MKMRFFLLSLFVLAGLSCKKDKFTTIPQYTITSISPTTVFNGNILQMDGKFTDKEGDVDSTLIIYKWYNGSSVVRNDTFRYSFSATGIPPKTIQGDVFIGFQYNTTNPNGYPPLPAATTRDTTATLGVILIDKANNRSAYAESQPIRLKRP